LERGDDDGRSGAEDLLAGDMGGEAAARLGWRFSWSSSAERGEEAANAESDREACRLRFRLSISIAAVN
jgi:hypothetical protein